ncbi:MAG TPA: hypothetical protein VNM45_09235 [Bacillus sp. (in: firmicutes)]|nr:hypothetical protein [Bacillus sp. (in: firmicutes)]
MWATILIWSIGFIFVPAYFYNEYRLNKTKRRQQRRIENGQRMTK